MSSLLGETLDAVYGYAFGRLGAAEAAEDVTVAVYIRYLQSHAEPVAEARASEIELQHLVAIARNEVLRRYRDISREEGGQQERAERDVRERVLSLVAGDKG